MKTENSHPGGFDQGGEGERQGEALNEWWNRSPYFFRFERPVRHYEPSREAWNYATETSADELARIIKGA